MRDDLDRGKVPFPTNHVLRPRSIKLLAAFPHPHRRRGESREVVREWLADQYARSPVSETYLRLQLDRVSSRRRQPPYHRDGRLIGYATLTQNAKPSRASGTWLRRVFWLAPHDRDQSPQGLYATGAPSEAVDPRTLEPTIKGYKTQRSEGGPASDAMREMGIQLPRV